MMQPCNKYFLKHLIFNRLLYHYLKEHLKTLSFSYFNWVSFLIFPYLFDMAAHSNPRNNGIRQFYS